MTRKEAIDRLDIIVSKHEVDDLYITLTNEKDYEALKVAINSLRIDEQYELEYEQAESKYCDDCVLLGTDGCSMGGSAKGCEACDDFMTEREVEE